MKRLILMMIKETTKWGSKYIFSGESHKTGPLCEILASVGWGALAEALPEFLGEFSSGRISTLSFRSSEQDDV